MKLTALIDGDIIAYTAAAQCEAPGLDWGTGEDSEPSFEEDDVRRSVSELIDAWTDKPSCTDRVVFLTGSLNFRKLVDPTYKANRKDARRPLALSFARRVMLEEHGAKLVDGLEADDLLGLSLTGSRRDDGVCVSLDKDLRTIAGRHFNPRKSEFVEEVTEDEGNHFWMTQCLTGDAVDGFGGCPGIGPAKAEKALQGVKGLPALWEAVKSVYASRKQSLTLALTTARLARILRKGDYNPQTKEVSLWHPSAPTSLRLPVPS
ncbi:hypothetical protein [Roseomonas sp. WA12]